MATKLNDHVHNTGISKALYIHFPVKSTQLDSTVKPKYAYQALAVDFCLTINSWSCKSANTKISISFYNVETKMSKYC